MVIVSDVSGIMSTEDSSNGRRDSVRRERMMSLKRSRAGHLGSLNKLYKDVKLLMRNAENYHEACVEIVFARCFQAYDEYYQFSSDPEVKSDALNACHSIMTGKRNLTNILKNGRDLFNVPRMKLQWFLANSIVIVPNHRLSHVQWSAQVAESQRAPRPVHMQVRDQERLKLSCFVVKLS